MPGNRIVDQVCEGTKPDGSACGTIFQRSTRKRKVLCSECAIAKAVAHMVSMHERTGQSYLEACRQGFEVKRQIDARSGPYYERWLRGMAAAVGYMSPSEPETEQPGE